MQLNAMILDQEKNCYEKISEPKGKNEIWTIKNKKYYVKVLYQNAKFLDFDMNMSFLQEIHNEMCGKMLTIGKSGYQVCEGI